MNRTVTAPRRRTLVLSVAALVGTAVLAPALPTAFANGSAAGTDDSQTQAVDIDVHAPTPAERAPADAVVAANVAAAAMPGADQPPTTRPTQRSPSATQRASTRKAPAVPRRAAARIDPDGTIDPYR